jgi:uncharacterized membrane protein YqjE
MAMHQRDVRGVSYEAPVGDLVRQFGQDSAMLVRQEIALARLELKEIVIGYAREAARLGVAVALAWFGAMALLAAVVIGAGALLANYWLGALLVAVVLLVVAAVLARSGLQQLKRQGVKPALTIETLQEDQQWVRREIRDLKRQLRH